MHWEKITERTYCVSVGNSLIGIYHLSPERVVLLDCGGGVDMEFMEELRQRKLEVRAILCSHLHFDHISMAGFVYDEFHMPSYAHHLEEKEAEFPTRDFPVSRIYDMQPIVIDGESFELIPTPGHTRGHLAFATPDGVCCVGDALICYETLKTAKIPYMDDVESAIKSMELLRQTNYRAYVLCHEKVVWPHELSELIDANIEEELRLYALIKEYVSEPMLLEDMVTGFMKLCGIRSSFVLAHHGYRESIRSRVISLDFAGELRLEGQWVMPIA